MKQNGIFLRKPVIIFLLGFTFLFFSQVQSSAQQAGKQVPVTVPKTLSTPNALLYLPWDYDVSSKSYPLICFFHGKGVIGNGGNALNRLPNQALPSAIKKGNPPFALNEQGDTTRFIVLSVQDPGYAPSPEAVVAGIASLLDEYHIRINTEKVYLSGISAGGQRGLKAIINYPDEFAAAVIMSPSGGMSSSEVSSLKNNHLWFFQGIYDNMVPKSYAYNANDMINDKYPGHSRITKYGNGHCCWLPFYEPDYREDVNGREMNIYEWMMQYSLGNADTDSEEEPPHQLPIAKAGDNMSISLPRQSVTLDGSASRAPDGEIVAYKWVQKSGPAGATIEDDRKAETVVSNLKEGTFVFTLTVEDDKGEKASANVEVKVKEEPNKKATGSSSNEYGVVADAGEDTTIYFPINNLYLDGGKSHTNGGILYSWKKISGPSSYLIKNPTRALTEIRNLRPGKYVFELKVTDYGKHSATDEVAVTVAPDPAQPGDVPFTANTNVPSYTGAFQYGTNPSSYGNGWDDIEIASIAEKAGAHSLRLPLPGQFVDRYGYDTRVREFDAYTHQLGMKELTLFVGRPGGDQVDRTTYPPATKHSAVFADLYTPIWDNGENGTPINDDNQFALYIYNLVKRYGDKVRFWEIVNEPDMTGFWQNDDLGRKGNWYESPPSPGSLPNLRAPIFYYIRMLRVAYEVVKKYYPDAYVAPGGLGYPAFLDALLRYTDNPDGGKVTSQYPLTGGAYFDVISFHVYPGYDFQKWDNAIGGFRWSRYSDRAADAIIDLKNEFDSVQVHQGYNDVKYPRKPFIMTETNLPRKTFDTYYGTNELQRNFIIKALVQSQKNGIEQFYVYHIGETGDYNTATNAYDLMGLYQNLKRDKYGQEKLTDEGIAFKTTSALLYGWKFDPARTEELQMPAAVEGAAFKKGNKYRYVLWARTHIDKSEEAQATYSFPDAVQSTELYRYEWDYSVDSKAKRSVGSKNISLTGVPSFFTTEKLTQDSTNEAPVASAGNNQAITLPTNSVVLDGSKSHDPDGTIVSYKWKKKSGPAAFNLADADAISTKVSGLEKGTYVFTLTVEDNEGAKASDEVTITVKAEPTQQIQPIANAGSDQTLVLPVNAITLDGSDSKGDIDHWRWDKKSGPGEVTIHRTNGPKATVTGVKAGTYIFTLTVSGETGWPSSSRVKVVVKDSDDDSGGNNPNPPGTGNGDNIQPVADAGKEQTVILPQNTILLDGSASTGSINSWRWDKRSGPGGIKIHRTNGPKASVTGFKAGTYVFTLTVSGETGWPSSSKVKVVVKEKGDGSTPGAGNNVQPVADAGSDQIVVLPESSVTLDGSNSTGSINNWRWDKRSGPGGIKIHRTNGPEATVTGLRAGTYVFTLTVSGETGWPSSGKVKVTVKSPYSRMIANEENSKEDAIAGLPGGKDNSIQAARQEDIKLNGALADKLTFKVYPNPVHNHLYMVLNNAVQGKIALRVVDINGRVVKTYRLKKQLKNFNHTIDVSGLAEGVYFVQLIEDGKLRGVRKVLKY